MRSRELNQSQRFLGALMLAIVVFAFAPSPAFAHADLDSTLPEDGAVLFEPLTYVEIRLTNDVEPISSGTRALDGDGSPIPFTLSQPESSTVMLVFDDPVESGRVLVLWEARSGDGHTIEGSIRVEVVDPNAPTTTTNPLPDTTTSTASTAATPSTTSTTVALTVAATPVADATADSESNDGTGTLLQGLGRWFIIVGVVLAIGAAAFATGALVGSRAEVSRAVRWINLGGLFVIIGTLVEIAGAGIAAGSSLVGAFMPSQIVDSLTTAHLVAVALRLIGAIGIMQGPNLISTAATGALHDGEILDPPIGVEGAVAVKRRPEHRLRLDLASEWLIVAGLGAVTLSFGLDGHSYAAGTVGSVASVVHVAAAGVWAGGLLVMADTLVRRRALGQESEVGATAIRFSRVASVAIAVVGIAGIALSMSIIESPSDILSTSWGRLLAAKTALVLVAVGVGGYNHFRVVPQMQSDPEATATLRRTVSVEAGIVLTVTVITAILAGATI